MPFRDYQRKDGNILLAPLSGDKTSKDFNLFVARQFSFSYFFLRLMFTIDHKQVYVKHRIQRKLVEAIREYFYRVCALSK